MVVGDVHFRRELDTTIEIDANGYGGHFVLSSNDNEKMRSDRELKQKNIITSSSTSANRIV